MSNLVYVKILKLRIALFIAMVAVMGYLVTHQDARSFQAIPLLFLISMMASAGAGSINNFLDRRMDCLMSRASLRPIPSGKITRPFAVLFLGLALLLFAALLSAVVFNKILALHILLGAFFYVVVYTIWLKRRHWISIVIGGLAGSFAVLGGGASASPELCLPPALFALLLFFWSPPHFWSLSLVYRDDYKGTGVPILPLVKGVNTTALGILLHVAALLVVSTIPWATGLLGLPYVLISVPGSLLFLYFAIKLLRHPENIKLARTVFHISNLYLLLLFIAVLVDVVLI